MTSFKFRLNEELKKRDPLGPDTVYTAEVHKDDDLCHVSWSIEKHIKTIGDKDTAAKIPNYSDYSVADAEFAIKKGHWQIVEVSL